MDAYDMAMVQARLQELSQIVSDLTLRLTQAEGMVYYQPPAPTYEEPTRHPSSKWFFTLWDDYNQQHCATEAVTQFVVAWCAENNLPPRECAMAIGSIYELCVKIADQYRYQPMLDIGQIIVARCCNLLMAAGIDVYSFRPLAAGNERQRSINLNA